MLSVSALFMKTRHARIQRGDQRFSTTLENRKAIGFLSNTGPDPLENHKATKPAFNVGPSSPANETPFKWRFTGGLMYLNGVSLVGRWLPAVSVIWILSLTPSTSETNKTGFAQAWKVLEFRGLSWKVLENYICLEKYGKITQKPWTVLEFCYFL